MPIRTYPTRVLAVTVALCGLLVALCGTVAVRLSWEQDRTAVTLGEDIGSRGAAIDLETTLNNLAVLHDGRSQDVAPLHAQARADLDRIDRFVDKPEERRLADRAADRFAEYLRRHAAAAPPAELAAFLRADTVPAVQELRRYNGRELARSQDEHRQALRRTAWGLAAVGGLGSVAGLVLGYGLARSLRRTITHFLVRVQGAADLLDQQLPAVEVARTGEPLADGGAELLRRVEQVVGKLHQREREVRRAERLAAVGQLAAGVAHEVRNPLTSAVLLLETARRDAAARLTDQDLELIEGELHRIERTLQGFLAFARPPKLERSAFDLVSLADEAVALCRGRLDQAGVAVAVDAPADGLTLVADREQVRQVLVNLLLNAADAMTAGGRLTVAVARDGNDAVVAVTDTGPGIPYDLLPRLFEPFATGKETGTGLGLVVSRRIAEDHGGTLAGANQPAGGARFELRLPLRPPAG